MARGKGIYKRGNVWWIRYAGIDGKIRFVSCGPDSFKEAEAKLTQKRQDVQDGKDTEPARRIGNHTFNDLAKKYLTWAQHQKAISSKEGFVKALVARFGNLPLRHFSTLLVEEYQTQRLISGDKPTTGDIPSPPNLPATVNRHTATLAHMIRKAVDWEMVGEDTLRRVRKVKQLPENNRRLRFLSGEEARALVDVCGKDHRGSPLGDLHLQRIVVCALSTGMRKGEILSLEWDRHIDLRHGFILLDKTKNGERRQIPISPLLRESLKGIVRRVDVPYVFHDSKGRRYKDVKTGFASACERSGLTDFRFHDLRHTFASLLVMGGVDLATVKDLLGHKEFKMTLRYAHLAPAHKVAALGILDGALRGDANYTITIQSNEKEVRAIAPTS
jgi:integrase